MAVREIVGHPRTPVFCPYDWRKIVSVREGQDNWLQYEPCGHWESANERVERIQREREERETALAIRLREERYAAARTGKVEQ